MKDMMGQEIKKHDVVAFANNDGFMALAYVLEADNELKVVYRGYRGAKERALPRPNDVIVVTAVADVANPEEAGRPEEVQFVQDLIDDMLVGELQLKLKR